MLGYASAALTLDTYTDLFDDDLDAVAERLDLARGRSASILRTFCGLRALLRSSNDLRREVREPLTSGFTWCPRQDSNLRTRLRRAVLYPLSYGGSVVGRGKSYQPPTT